MPPSPAHASAELITPLPLRKPDAIAPVRIGTETTPFLKGIALRITLLGWAVMLLTLGIFIATIVPQQKREFRLNLESKARGVAASIRSAAAGAAVSADYSAVVDQAMQVLSADQAIDYVIMTKNDGFSIVIDRSSWKTEILGTAWRPALRVPTGSIGSSPPFRRRVFQYAYPFDYSGIEWGWIHVGLSLNAYDASVQRTYIRTAILAFLCGALGLMVWFVYARRLVQPIEALASVARLVTSGRNYSIRAKKTTEDEIGSLVDSFNEMLTQIDVRERSQKIAEDALRESEERYALAVRGANDGLWDWKLDTNKIYFSPRWTRMLGYSDHESWSDPKEWFSRIHPADRARVEAQLAAHRQGATPEFSSEFRMRDKDGRYIWMLSRGIAIRDAHGVAVRIAGSQTDITEGKTADPLTGLPNRNYFTDKVESALGAKKNPGAAPFAVLFLDLDRFKTVNDSLGHEAGDQLLKGVAQRLRLSVRGDDTSGKLVGPDSTVARLGGDEFAILLEGIHDEHDAQAVAERILKRFAVAFIIDGRNLFAGCCIGVAMGSSAGTPDDLLRNADTAMYSAKTHGRGAFAIFNQGMRERAVARIEIEADLKKAIAGNQLEVYYQPEVSMSDHQITGFEALVRWNHPARGLLYPGEFISVAEESGLIVPLGLWVLREACRQMVAWHRSMPRIPALTISVNVSYKQLATAGLGGEVEHILTDTGLDPRYLKLEMTESSVIENAEVARVALMRFKELKIGLEIDDFGTGYSSLGYLRQLPFDTLKIDYSFVKELGTSVDSTGVIRTIFGLAKSLNMNVVAEGVETKDQLVRLKAMGCTTAQGFYFSKPVDAAQAGLLIGDVAGLKLDGVLPPMLEIGSGISQKNI